LKAAQPDFSIVERTWEARLRQRGLTPSRVGTGVATGYQRLELYRQETQVAEFDFDQPLGRGFIGSVEVRVVLDSPHLGDLEVHDLVTQRGRSLEGALEACANTFMDVTFPPLEALFTGGRPQGPGTGTLTLTSFNVDLNRAIKWDVVLGQLQILNDPDGQVQARLKSQPSVTLILDTLVGHLAGPRLHWCKLYGANKRSAGLVFRCVIDGHRSTSGEAEVSRKFGEPPPGEWEFRQFLVLRPMGDADSVITAGLRARAAEAFPGKKKSWWSRLFG